MKLIKGGLGHVDFFESCWKPIQKAQLVEGEKRHAVKHDRVGRPSDVALVVEHIDRAIVGCHFIIALSC
jgi:hypothetical protein